MDSMHGGWHELADDWQVRLHPRVRVRLESYRLNRYIGDGSLPHLALGRAADPLIDRFHDMAALHDQGAPDWFERGDFATLFSHHDGVLRLHDALYFDPPTTLLDPDLAFVLRWDGSVREVRIPADRQVLSTLHEMVALLARRPSLAELRSRLATDDWALLTTLGEVDAITLGPAQQLVPRTGCTLSLIAHSCILVETPTTRLLVDPVLSVRYRPGIDLSSVLAGGLDAVVISHPHWDHFNPDSLMLIEPAARIIVPSRQRQRSLVNIDMEALCHELGFGHTTGMRPWERITVGDIAITALPYFGEGSGAEGAQDWMTYAIEAGGRLIVGMVDACTDDFGAMDAVLARVRRELGPIDILLSPCSDFRFTHRHFHCRPIVLDATRQQFTGSATDTARWAEIGAASAIVPYAEFFFDAADPDTAEKSPGQEGSWRDLHAAMPTGSRLVPLRPGDSWSLR